MNDIDWNEKVKEALDRTEFMAISTIGADGNWTCPVQFGHSEKLDLYFRSMPHSKHMRHLLADNRISVAIFKTERFPGSREVMGLQLKGKAARLTEPSERRGGRTTHVRTRPEKNRLLDENRRTSRPGCGLEFRKD